MRRTVHLMRHADADPRVSWSEPDARRPLSKLGRAQAMELAHLDVGPATAILSSPAVRCIGTVVPLADRLGTEVQVDDRLAEGADPRVVVDWLMSSVSAEMILCGHGDLLPEVLRLLTMRGMTLDGPNACQKASVWTCTIDDDEARHACYRPPPAAAISRVQR